MADRTIIEKLAKKSVPHSGEQDCGCGFIPGDELKAMAKKVKAPKTEAKEVGKEKADPEDSLKEACAYQIGLQFAWKEAGIDDDVRRHILTKTAVALQSGEVQTYRQLAEAQEAYTKEAAEIFGDVFEEQVKTAEVSPDVKLLLLALGGAGVGGAGGYAIDKIREKLSGRKSRNNMALLGALGGATAGVTKHIHDRALEDTAA